MINLLRRLRRKLLPHRVLGSADARVDWAADLRITHLAPVKRVYDGNAANKAGRLVLRGRLGPATVKVYELASAEHARFVRHVSQTGEVGDHWPPVLGCRGRFIVTDWIKGRAMRVRPNHSPKQAAVLGELATFQARLHGTPADTMPRADFDYWNDLIKPRLRRACAIFGADPLCDQVCSLVDRHWQKGPAVLMHPDLRPANIVRTRTGYWYLIDNELLTAGAIPLIDLLITLQALPAQVRPAYLALYSEARGGLTLSPEHEGALVALWFAREMSRRFVAGDIAAARDLLSAYRAGHALLPLPLRAAAPGPRIAGMTPESDDFSRGRPLPAREIAPGRERALPS